jgi:UDP-N-acetyl-D-glucosamine dehydrogenase
LGVAYKRDVSDVRESPALAVIHGLMRRGGVVSYLDPFVPELDEEGITLKSVDGHRSFGEYDAVVVITDHSAFDRNRVLGESKLVVDTRDFLCGIPGDRSKVYGL